MATVLDVSVLEFFSPLFIFLFVLFVFYAILDKTKILGENKGLSFLTALVVALLFVITTPALQIVETVTPWLVVMLVVFMAIIIILLFIGVKADTISEVVSSRSSVWMIVIVLVLLLGVALTNVIGPNIASLTQEGDTAGFGRTIGKVIFHPSILGAALLLAIASQAVRFIAQ
jgi:hypothetical protein